MKTKEELKKILDEAKAESDYKRFCREIDEGLKQEVWKETRNLVIIVLAIYGFFKIINFLFIK